MAATKKYFKTAMLSRVGVIKGVPALQKPLNEIVNQLLLSIHSSERRHIESLRGTCKLVFKITALKYRGFVIFVLS